MEAALRNGPEALNELEQEGAIQRFEYTYELGWKTLKDFLQHSGVSVDPITMRAVIKSAFAANLLPDGQVWLDMLDHRNQLSHDYDEEQFAEALRAIADRYLPALKDLHERLGREI